MLNRHNFEIAELAPTDEILGPLCGIQVSVGGTVVTDGRAAIIVTGIEEAQSSLFDEAEGVIPADFFTPFVLDRDSALRIAKSLPKKKGDGDVVNPIVDATTEDSDRAMVSINDMSRQEIIRAKKMGGKFPDVCQVVPSRETAKFTIPISPELLLDVMKVVHKFCSGRETFSMTVSLYGANKPIRFDVDGSGQTLTAVVMPLKELEKEAGE